IPALRSRIARKARLTSCVKIDDESPYLIPFETRMASSRSRTYDRRRRPEDLLLGDAHLGVDVAEDRRAIVEALAETVARSDLAAGQQLRPLVAADLRVGVDLLERGPVDHRPDVRFIVPTDPEPQLLRLGDQAGNELVIDGLVRTDSARRRAAMARGAERGPDDALDGQVEIGVVEDDDRVLAAQLEVHVLEPVGRGLRHCDTRLTRARERDYRHVRVRNDR